MLDLLKAIYKLGIDRGTQTNTNGHSETRKKTSLKKHTLDYVSHRNIYITNILGDTDMFNLNLYFSWTNEETS